MTSEPSPAQPTATVPPETQLTGVTGSAGTEPAPVFTPEPAVVEPVVLPADEPESTPTPSGGLRQDIIGIPQAAKETAGNLFDKLKAGVVNSVNAVLDKLTDLGVPALNFVGKGTSFLAEVFGPASMWVPKVALVGAGWGLDKLGSRHPDSRICRLAKALGEGAWKGGALGGATSLLVNTILPPEVTMHVVPGGAHVVVKETVLPTDAAGRDIAKFLRNLGIGSGSLAAEAAKAKQFVIGQAGAVSPQFGQGVADTIQAGENMVGEVGRQLGAARPQIDQMVGMAASGKDSLANFLTTPVGRIAGIFGIGGLVYKLFGPKKAAA